MAQTLNEIQDGIITDVENSAELPAVEILTENEQNSLANITTESRVSIFRHIVYVIARAIWALQQLWDIYVMDVEERIAASKPFTLQWYKSTALNYQHGFALDDNGDYINGEATDEEIDDSKIVTQVAFEKATINGHGVLRCKVAKDDEDDLTKLTPEELEGFDAYINKKTAFGLRVVSISRDHDNLVVDTKIWYDPQILDGQGRRKDGTNDTPVIDAINAYLKSIEFNGEFVKTYLVDALQKVDGVKIPKLLSAYSNTANLSMQAELSDYVGEIDERRQTFAGYMRLDVNNSNFEYVPY